MAEPRVKATVLEALPSIRFRVQLEGGREMIAYLGGRLNRAMIRVLVGDAVELVVPPIGNIARIVKRL